MDASYSNVITGFPSKLTVEASETLFENLLSYIIMPQKKSIEEVQAKMIQSTYVKFFNSWNISVIIKIILS